MAASCHALALTLLPDVPDVCSAVSVIPECDSHTAHQGHDQEQQGHHQDLHIGHILNFGSPEGVTRLRSAQ